MAIEILAYHLIFNKCFRIFWYFDKK